MLLKISLNKSTNDNFKADLIQNISLPNAALIKCISILVTYYNKMFFDFHLNNKELSQKMNYSYSYTGEQMNKDDSFDKEFNKYNIYDTIVYANDQVENGFENLKLYFDDNNYPSTPIYRDSVNYTI